MNRYSLAFLASFSLFISFLSLLNIIYSYYFNLYLNDFDKFEEYIKSDNLDICKDILESNNQDIYKVINNKEYYSFVAVFTSIFKLQFN